MINFSDYKQAILRIKQYYISHWSRKNFPIFWPSHNNQGCAKAVNEKSVCYITLFEDFAKCKKQKKMELKESHLIFQFIVTSILIYSDKLMYEIKLTFPAFHSSFSYP